MARTEKDFLNTFETYIKVTKDRLKKAAGKVIDKENYFGKSEIPEKAMETEKEIKAKE